jgi:hypothetical protein
MQHRSKSPETTGGRPGGRRIDQLVQLDRASVRFDGDNSIAVPGKITPDKIVRWKCLLLAHRGADIAQPSAVYRSVSRATPSAKLTPTWPSTDNGCREIVRWDPPTSTLAPRPRPNEALPLAPT